MSGQRLCPGCFLVQWDGRRCPSCGYEGEKDAFHSVLDPGAVLLDRYEIGRILGKPGGFGITYLAYDRRLHRRVALKELMPRELVGRVGDGATLQPHTREDQERFRSTLSAFLEEARTLAKFSHPNVVRVLDYFEANGTAYFAMEFYEGETLSERVSGLGRALTDAEMLGVARPLLSALEQVHEAGVLHRDIKPSNIYLTRDDHPVLLDFGSARMSMGVGSRTLTSVLTPGYAPFEQYHGRGDQGPWTDVYGVAATLYFLLTREPPPEAGLRMEGDPLVPPALRDASLSPALSDAVMRGLAMRPQDRPGTARAFLDLLEGKTATDEGPERTLEFTGPPPTLRYMGDSPVEKDATLRYPGSESHTPQRRVANPETHRRLRRLPVAAAVLVLTLGGAALAIRGLRTEDAIAPVRLSTPESDQPDGRPAAVGTTGLPSPVSSGPDAATTASGGGPTEAADQPGAPPGGPASNEAPSPRAPKNAGRSQPSGSASAPRPASPAAAATGVAVVVFGDAGTARQAESILLASLLRVPGLTALDAGALQMIRGDDDALQSALRGDVSALATVAQERGAVYAVVADLATSSQPSRASFHSGSATLDLRLYRIADGALLGSETFSVGAGGEPARTGLSPQAAMADAARAAAQAGAAALARWVRRDRR